MKPVRLSLAKTARPSVSAILPRKRLFALLDRGREGGAVWISGPPGCGKTTLAASWAEHARITSLWYQLDDGDADVATFFYYLGLAAADLGCREPLPSFAPEHQAALPQFSRRYFQHLFSQLNAPFAVVFDGCNEVPASSPLHDVLRIALQEMPPGGCAVLVSRGDPPAGFARLRANRSLIFVGWEELRLTREETGSIVAQRFPGVASSAVDVLFASIEGWAAGLVLMLEQARFAGAIGDAPTMPARQLVFDYLAGEIFQKSDSRTQNFLLRTAFLPRMSAAMAAELTGDGEAGGILAELHRNNYFITRRETEPAPLYQYHPMLRDFLQARAGEALGKEVRRQLQRESARCMREAGNAEDAVSLYRDSHDWAAMAQVIEDSASAMLAYGRGETVGRWVEELPAETQVARPWTIYWSASSRAQLAPREARLLYEKAFELFRGKGDGRGAALACSGAMDAILYELDDFSLLDRWIAVLDEAGGARRESIGPPEMETRIACSMFVSLTLRQPQRRDIPDWIERSLAASRRVPDVNLAMSAGLLAALTLMWTGLFARAAELIAAMQRAARTPGVTTFSMLTLNTVQAMHGALTADRDASLAAMREGLELAHATGVHTWTFQLLIYGYGSALGQNDLETAGKLEKELEAHAGSAGRFNLCLYRHFRAWGAMLRRDLMDALQHEKAALRMAVEVGCPFFEVLCRLALAEILAECGDERKCIAHLQTLRGLVRQIDNAHLEFTCLVGFAQIALERGRIRPGLNALRRGMELGRQYGYAHFLWWRPAAVARALANALEAGIEPDYARSLIVRRGLAAEARMAGVEAWPWIFRVHAFGGFRLQVRGEPLPSTGKAQRKPLELLKMLIAQGGQQVSEARIADALWPRVEGDSAHRSFTSALHRLRKLLGEDSAIVLHEGRVTLDRRFFWIDAWAFEQLAAELDAERDPARIEKLAERLVALYAGPFMADEEASWSVQPRERLRLRFLRAVGSLCRTWELRGEPERARLLREKSFEIEPLARTQADLIHR